MAGHEVSLRAQVRAADEVRTEPQMRDRHRAGLLGIVDEVALCVVGGVTADNLDRVLVGADRSVRAETVEHTLDAARMLRMPGLVNRQAGVGHVVVDADGEVVLGRFGGKVVEYGLDHRRRELLGTESVPAAGRARVTIGLEPFLLHRLAQGGANVDVQRFADGARLLGPIKDPQAFDRGGNCLGEGLGIERTIQADLDHADFLALADHVFDRFVHGLRAGTHHDEHALGIRRSDIVEQAILAAGQLGKRVHGFLDDRGRFVVIGVYSLAALEIDVRILSGAADARIVRGQAAVTMLDDKRVVDHGAHDVARDLLDLL